MWIIPKNLQLSSGAPDTAGFISDLNEQSQICASSLMVRSKPSQPRIWSQKWKRDSWTQHLSGRILKPSHAKPFETEWTCLWPVIHASHFQQQASVSESKTLATSGRTSQEQLELFALDSASSRMSKDISASDSEKSLESWEQSVTRRRGEYSLRVKSARLTSASGSSSWLTVSMEDAGRTGSAEAWNQYRDQQRTTQARLRNQVYGQAAPANPSTLGSRQGLWLTPRANEPDNDPNFAARNADRGAHCHGTLSSQAKQLWPTITAHTPDMESNGPNGHSGTYLAGAVKAEENWVTPRTSGTSTRPNKTTPRQGLTLIEQARANEWRTPTVAEEKNQGTSSQIYLQNQVGATVKQWATPQASDPEHSGPNQRDSSGRPALPAQAMQWGTPTARDHKSGRGNEEREYKELTPMVERTQSGKLNPRWVETLMGLPVGWTMPSCASPVTTEQTSCDSSATESCLPPLNELFES